MLRMAVVGGGHLGRIHARLLADAPNVSLVAVADPVADARQQAAAAARTAAVEDYRDLFGRIDAAVVATPTRLHHRVALDLIEHGVHVLVEKPITTTLAEADELISAARRYGVVLQVGHVERFNPAWKALAGRFAPGNETPRYIESLRCGPYTCRSIDVGVTLDLLVHDVDIALSLMGEPVVRIDAIGQAVIGPFEDIANARLQFASGAVANLSASRVSYQAERRMRIFAAGGFASVDFGARCSTLVDVSPAVAAGTTDVNAMSADEKNRFKETFFHDILPMRQLPSVDGNAIADEHLDFAQSIRDQHDPRVTGEQGRAALAVCQEIAAQIATQSDVRSRSDRARTLAHPAILTPDPRRQAG